MTELETFLALMKRTGAKTEVTTYEGCEKPEDNEVCVTVTGDPRGGRNEIVFIFYHATSLLKEVF